MILVLFVPVLEESLLWEDAAAALFSEEKQNTRGIDHSGRHHVCGVVETPRPTLPFCVHFGRPVTSGHSRKQALMHI